MTETGLSFEATKVHRALGDPSRIRILAALRGAAGPLDASQIATGVGLHANTVRSHLHVLMEAHLVSSRPEERHRRGRPRVVYAAVAEGAAAEQSAGYRLLAEILASYLAVADAEQAGRAWGISAVEREARATSVTSDEAVARVVGLLDEFGFEPRLAPTEQGLTVLMEHCPFGEMAEESRSTVCQVHLGLMQGALAKLGAGVEADSLEPFASPGVCVAHLERIAAHS